MRHPVVAGAFYPKTPEGLRKEMDRLWPEKAPAVVAAFGAMVPHAGYIYSGRTAAAIYARLKPSPAYILLGPNHTGRGGAVAMASAEEWETPLGRVSRDEALAQAIARGCAQVAEDDAAHHGEHSLEVQLPFLQRSGSPFSMVALALATMDLKALRAVGEAMAKAIAGHPTPVMMLASSDMNHFENLERTQRLDQLALERIEALDPEGLIQVVLRLGISMCGAGPTAAMLFAARAMGASKAECVVYTTSAETSGDDQRVVGYAGVIVT